MNNNWHIKIADCNEAQKERLKQVYGDLPININTYLGLHNGIVISVFGPDGMGELITPDEAFRRLGLYPCETSDGLLLRKWEENKKTIRDLQQKIKELEQQLAAKPEVKGVDWSIVELEYKWLAQNVHSGNVDFYEVKPTGDSYILLATRPKPKLTSEQIDAAKKYDEWLDLNSGDFEPEECFDAWLKEVGNE